MPIYKKTKTCPRCGRRYTAYPALSRRDNETEICPSCGTLEAFEDAGYAPEYTERRYWTAPKTRG